MRVQPTPCHLGRLLLAFALLLAIPCAKAQQLDLPAAAVDDPGALAARVPGLAREVAAAYREEDHRKYLDSLFHLQVAAGQYPDAGETLRARRALPAGPESPVTGPVHVPYEIYEVVLRAKQSIDGVSFDDALRRAFREVLGALDDPTSVVMIRALNANLAAAQQRVDDVLGEQKGKNTIALADALRLIKAYQVAQTLRVLAPLAPGLIAEDDLRRYVIDRDVAVRTPDGATICTLVVRPRGAAGRLPTLLTFTIYAGPDDVLRQARWTAAQGYASVVGLTRGKGCSPDAAVPYEHDADDASALIDWISSQPWSDGRAGMYGGSYSGFTAWAAAKRMPKALKALMVGAPVAPGIDVPMEGNVVWSFVYPWPFYTTNVKTVDDATYSDSARWSRLNHDWYVSGRPYRDLEKIDGTPNPIFARWLAHPSNDPYWQSAIPYQEEFARIDIPVLTTAGYYFGGPGAAVYYLTQHAKYRPGAQHYLVIGPYEHFQAQTGTVGVLGGTTPAVAGYPLDPAAQVDFFALRYQWFDYVLKGGPKPALLADKVNYEVMGANVWKHAPSLAAMANQTLRLYLGAARTGDAYRLSERRPTGGAFIRQTVDLADRTDVDRVAPGGGILDRGLDTANAVELLGDPLPKPTELSGLFSGHLDFVTNKKDFDFSVSLFELTPKGDYVQLSACWSRASYVGDPSHRRLLTPGKRQRLDFESSRLMSRRLEAGSRLVVVLGVIKEPGRQINYGTGKDVNDETIADAKEPLEIRWSTDSYLDLPVWR